jgi:peptide/nickel transport system permease protein
MGSAVQQSSARFGFARQAVGFVLSMAATLLGLTAVTFSIGRFIPIDPVLAIVGDHAAKSTYDRVRLEIGLDRSVPEQYLLYLKKVLAGDFGHSVMTSNPVLSDLAHFFPATLELATIATILGVAIGVPAGIAAAAMKGRWPDHLVRFLGLFGYSMPIFWLGLVGLWLFYAKLGWVGGPGRLDVGYDDVVGAHTGVILIDSAIERNWDVFADALTHLVLPASLLAYISLAYVARMTRSFMIEQLSQEYVVAARIKGCSYWRAVWRHAFPNILVPLSR